MKIPSLPLGLTIDLISGGVAGLAAILIPAVFFAFSFQALQQNAQSDVWFNARVAADLFDPKAPDARNIDRERLRAFLSRRPVGGYIEMRRLLSLDNHVVMQVGGSPPAPVLVRQAMIRVDGRDVGMLEIGRSLRQLLLQSGITVIPGLLAGWLIFGMLRRYPLRALQLAMHEIDQRKATEVQLQKSLSIFAATLESTADGILVVDTKNKAVVSNQRFLQMWKLDRPPTEFRDSNEFWGLLLAQMEFPKDFLASRNHLRDHPEEEDNLVMPLKDKKVYEVHSRPERIEGMVVGRVWSFRDISQREWAGGLLNVEKQVLENVVGGSLLTEAMGVLARHIEDMSGRMFCAVLFRGSEREQHLQFATGPSLPRSYVAALQDDPSLVPLSTIFARDPNPLTAAVTIPEITSAGDWTRYRTLVTHYGVEPGLQQPITSRTGHLLGLIVAHYRPDTHQPQDQELLQIGRNLASIAIERKQAEENLYSLAHFDTLTSLPNRRLFHDRVEHALVRATRSGKLAAVMFLDLDRFKTINDTLGHEAGDQLLRTVAERLRQCVREEDTVARLGGDEFTIVLEEIPDPDLGAVVAQKILQALEPSLMLGGQEVYISASIGISVYPMDSDTLENLLKNADTAMYRAKESGRNNYKFYSPEMNSSTLEHLEMETSLRRALDRNEFILYYQPKVSFTTGQIVGMEVLLRWERPEVGLVPPSEFIPILEETGLITPVGDWILRTACTQNRRWQELGLMPVCVAVNLSARQFDERLLDTVANALAQSGLEPGYLELEVTESLLMRDPDEAITMLEQIRELGVANIDVDDFGTGYSSLSYLKRFPISAVKIDQSFVRGVPDDDEDNAICEAVIAMSHSLGLKVIAEGVENQRQLEFLGERKCDEIQGFYCSPPVPADEFEKLLVAGEGLRRCDRRMQSVP